MDRPDGWVYVVAMNQLRDHWRRSERRREREPEVDEGTVDNTSAVATRLSVRDAIATLPPRQRQAVVLRYLADLPIADVADAMGCAIGTVKATLHQAMRNMRGRARRRRTTMQIDELRGELATLADEIEPFVGDVRALHRRQRRRRVVTSSFAVALAVVVAVSVIALSHRDNGRVHVAAGSKEVTPAQMSHVDAIVVPANPDVEKILDASPIVVHYARIPRSRTAARRISSDRPGTRGAMRPRDERWARGGNGHIRCRPGRNIANDARRTGDGVRYLGHARFRR